MAQTKKPAAARLSAEKIPARLRAAKAEKGLTSEALSTLAGIGESSVRHYLAGTKEPGVKALIALGKALGKSIDWLCGG